MLLRAKLKILDFACGNGENGIYAAQCGADVIGIDIWPEGIENANLNAKQAEVADHCRFEVMDGENMTFPDNTFDLAVEYGALHHLDLHAACRELSRILKPEGKLICTEALRHNPLIHWYRKRTPNLRTQWEVEHILGIHEIESGRKYFSALDIWTFYLAALSVVPLRRTFFFESLLIWWIEYHYPFLRGMAWAAVFYKPRTYQPNSAIEEDPINPSWPSFPFRDLTSDDERDPRGAIRWVLVSHVAS